MTSDPSFACRRSQRLRAAMAVLVAAGPALAQIFPTYPWPQQQLPQSQWQQGQQQPQNPQGSPYPQGSPFAPQGSPFAPQGSMPNRQPYDPNGLFPTWVRPDAFQGFPQFPPSLGTMQAQPMGVGLLGGEGQLPPPAVPLAPDWPAWVKKKRPEALPYEPSVAVLVRQADRVWFRSVDEDAAVPLYHYDNARPLTEGADVEVRRTGEFLLLLHGGSRIASFGTCKARLGALDGAGARIDFGDFTWLDLSAAKRSLVCRLPDGSELEIPKVAPEQDGQPGFGDAHVRIERAIEPGHYAGRAIVFNHGARSVVWHTAFGDVTIVPGHRVTLFLSDSTQALSASLREDAAAAMAQGEKRVWDAAENGAVTWSGARFELPTGARLELDPLLGDPFAPNARNTAPAMPGR